MRARLTGTPVDQKIETLAVLSLENLSGDSGQDYFAAGMTETLITDLARLGGLKRVTARGSVMYYQGTRRPFSEIARELNVDALVTGLSRRPRPAQQQDARRTKLAFLLERLDGDASDPFSWLQLEGERQRGAEKLGVRNARATTRSQAPEHREL